MKRKEEYKKGDIGRGLYHNLALEQRAIEGECFILSSLAADMTAVVSIQLQQGAPSSRKSLSQVTIWPRSQQEKRR